MSCTLCAQGRDRAVLSTDTWKSLKPSKDQGTDLLATNKLASGEVPGFFWEMETQHPEWEEARRIKQGQAVADC